MYKNIIQPLLLLFVIVNSTACFAQKNVHKKAKEYISNAAQHYAVQEYEEAKKYLHQALKKQPDFLAAMDLLAKIDQVTGKTEQAKHGYLGIFKFDPTYPMSQYELATIYFSQKNFDSTVYYADAFLKHDNLDESMLNEMRKRKRDAIFCTEMGDKMIPFEPENLGPKVNSRKEEYLPGLTVDERQLFFTRRDASLDIYSQNEDIYRSVKYKGLEWIMAKNLGGPINTPENEGAFTTSADGRYLFFTSCKRPNGEGSCDIWVAVNNNGKWSKPFNLRAPINTTAWETQPTLSADGKTLYFVSNRKGGLGGSDIYKAEFTAEGWTEPVNLGPEINTPYDEQFPFIHQDNETLYFSSEGHPGYGMADLFMAKKTSAGWSTPKNLGAPVNTSRNEWNLIVDRSGKKAYIASDGIKPSYGGMDLYSFDLPEELTAEPVSFVQGYIFDAVTKKPLSGNIVLEDLNKQDKSIETVSNKNNGGFLVTLRPNRTYGLNVSAPGYLFHTESFDLTETTADKPYRVDIFLNKPETGNAIVLNNLFFDTDKFDLKPQSYVELEKLVTYLTQNPDLNVEIGGHTDNQGGSSHNQSLSENRALAVVTYLIIKGIAQSRLTHKGYGDAKPIADNATEVGRKQNRRTEVKIME